MERGPTTALLLRARAGSDEALNALFERCAGKLLALIRLRLGRDLRARLESRDILNATLLKAFERLDQLDGADGTALMGWLARIAENEIRDQRDWHHRQRRAVEREVALDAGLSELAARVATQTERLRLKEDLTRLERALEELDEIQREVVVLRKLEELSFPEIGRRLGRSPDACRMLFARAMASLTLRMGEQT